MMVRAYDTRAPVRKGTETILLVDDEEMILTVSAEILESLGYEVLTAPFNLEDLSEKMRAIFEQE
jgi:CheY-like chemotaxis protein